MLVKLLKIIKKSFKNKGIPILLIKILMNNLNKIRWDFKTMKLTISNFRMQKLFKVKNKMNLNNLNPKKINSK
jgi:hypothetical protein